MVNGSKCSNGVSGNMPVFQTGVVSSNLVYCTNISGRDGSQSCLISKTPCVRLTPPKLKHQDMEKIIQSLISPTLAAIMEKLHNEKVVREDIVNIFCNNEGKYVAVYYK